MMARGPSGKRTRVKLAKGDWQEIYYALLTKAIAVVCARYGAETRPGQDRLWVRHLRRIMIKIGPDGLRAYKCGVAKAK